MVTLDIRRASTAEMLSFERNRTKRLSLMIDKNTLIAVNILHDTLRIAQAITSIIELGDCLTPMNVELTIDQIEQVAHRLLNHAKQLKELAR
jgi:hypothetical protein